MTWRVSLDSHGNGRIQSDDCDGDGIKITGVRDVHEFVQAIDVIIREGGSWNFIREDGALVEIYPSQSRPGKYVIERQNGAWIRLSREELREVRNELLRRISAPAPSRAEEIEDSSGEQNDAFHTFLRKYRELSKLNQETYERVRGYAEIVARLRDKK